MLKERILENLEQNDINQANIDELYEAIVNITKDEIENKELAKDTKTIYYMSAEFLMGKMLSNNLMNLGLYDEVDVLLKDNKITLQDLENYEPEPSLGNGGLGRLAACFLDSIATLGISGEGMGLNYHFGLFKQVFQNHKQVETKDEWLNRPSWLRKSDFVTPIDIAGNTVHSRMYEMDVMGYNGKKIPLRLFDLEEINETLVEEGITFDPTKLNENLTLFLYPDDSTQEGIRLRFMQQYFMVSSNLAWILEEHKDHIDNLQDYVRIQINDTHPSMVIVLLIENLLKHGISMDKAIEMTTEICAYTNHTILREALETWPLSYFEAVDSEMVSILWELQNRLPKDEDTAIIDKNDVVHMAHLAIHYSYSTNGVAALHTEILKHAELKDFYEMYPERFNNKTNGITFRRWLLFSNRELSNYIESLIGDGFKHDAMELEKLLAFKDNDEVLENILRIKQNRKEDLNAFLTEIQDTPFNTDSILDIQIKRLHEYKRQQLNLLYIVHTYLNIKKGILPKRPITFIFGSKAAPAYTIAKDIIHALLTLSEIIAKDAVASKYIQVIFVENYNVSKAEMLIPACDVSEQISLASKEASGTGNMKLMLNGALTLGTMDGANVEIEGLVGRDNIYIFGESSDTIIELYEKGTYVSKEYYDKDPELKAAVDFLISDVMKNVGSEENLNRLHHELVSKDWFMTFVDFKDYVKVKNTMFNAYEDRKDWAKKMLINIAMAGFFSSDRTIKEYNDELWKV